MTGCIHQFVSPSGPCTWCGVNCCCICSQTIDAEQLYMEVRQRDDVDEDARYLAHVVCVGATQVSALPDSVRVELIAAALPASFTLDFAQTTDQRIEVVRNVLEAAAAVDAGIARGTLKGVRR